MYVLFYFCIKSVFHFLINVVWGVEIVELKVEKLLNYRPCLTGVLFLSCQCLGEPFESLSVTFPFLPLLRRPACLAVCLTFC